MTSGNGNTNSGQHNGESIPAQALVKSHILTHLIEGFVIQEGAEPFPVERPSFSIESLRRHTGDSKMDGLSSKELKVQQEPMLTCELCGRVDFAYIFKRSKRFCSTVCAKRYNVGCTKRMGLFPNRKTSLENVKKQRALNGNHKNYSLDSKKKTALSVQKPTATALSPSHSVHPAQGESSQCSDLSGYKRTLPPLLATQRVPVVQGSELPLLPYSYLPSDPSQWNIADVYEFISSLSVSLLPCTSIAACSFSPTTTPASTCRLCLRGNIFNHHSPISHVNISAGSDTVRASTPNFNYVLLCDKHFKRCLEIAEEFRSQEIDGQALLLLKEDHLMGTMNIKLGPALKIFAQISILKDS